MEQKEHKQNGWAPEELGEESSYEGRTEMNRRLRRGDETKDDPDERDLAGAPDVGETPDGREDQTGTHVRRSGIPVRERRTTARGKLKELDD